MEHHYGILAHKLHQNYTLLKKSVLKKYGFQIALYAMFKELNCETDQEKEEMLRFITHGEHGYYNKGKKD